MTSVPPFPKGSAISVKAAHNGWIVAPLRENYGRDEEPREASILVYNTLDGLVAFLRGHFGPVSTATQMGGYPHLKTSIAGEAV